MTSTSVTTHNSRERVFTSTDTGPVLADITCPDGTVRVTVDPAATVARVQIRTDDPTGPAVQAVLDTRIEQTPERLTVAVPPLPATAQRQFHHGGTVFISGNSHSVVQVSGVGFISHDGRGITVSGSTGVEVIVVLPAGSSAIYAGGNGSIHTHGVLAALKAETTNGSIKADVVGRVGAEAANGSIRVGTVTEWIDAEAGNGSIKIDTYAGSTAQVRAGNGSVTVTVAPAATGRITARAGNGNVKIHGVRNRTDLDIRATASNGTVKKPA
ncbi:DUF4097 family beta strand repeat-containing protein [Streptomyces clavuligerus]|uniref:DUF4097 family beta strand repeat-containing protein n=1 Tax=Streptomyces clavuligerus TaxID=1901 RepID=UPI000185177F|nr:DUF4097 family beta strand repeat-containing protein [Streptomyces clavuligerus]AXU16813.1 hypothetical protein D1794_29030 [Streptomyces clavuligerus]MBY6300947.1 DUF4097 family beta strand repeat protein [Streptomyces clavuligerus]QPJ97040.1 hypothetical protein GE265_28425 [Streptomyces clavuligerus]WDN55758.1 DUF4097 family beta strand repeat-containing protein [Streptomyces clavuligerus]